MINYGAKLNLLREQLDANAITVEIFEQNVKQVLEELKTMSDEQKLRLADDVIDSATKYLLDPFTREWYSDLNKTLYMDSDNTQYLFEMVMESVFTKSYWTFHNKTFDN